MAKAKASPAADLRLRAQQIYRVLARQYPDAKCALHHENPFQLLVATILSAQCTDARVNMVTPALFAKYPTPQAMAQAPLEQLQQQIRSTGFFRNKAKSLKQSSEMLARDFGGCVPDSMQELLKLPGVARKTANVILGNAFGKNEGVVVDTHVARVSARLGLTRHADPIKIERDLMRLYPAKDWTLLAHLLIFHGRALCTARKPRCESCPISRLCPQIGIASRPGTLPRRARQVASIQAASATRAWESSKIKPPA